MATVLTLCGLGSALADWVAEIMMANLFGGEVVGGNTHHYIAYNSLGGGDANVDDGVTKLDEHINSVSGEKIVFGFSLGGAVATKWLAVHGPTSEVPPAELSFVVAANPARRYGGLLHTPYFNHPYSGMTEYWAPVDTPYTVVDFARQYDGVCDFPTDVESSNYWLAQANAVVGMALLHSDYYSPSLTADTNVTYVEGNITYVLSPTRPWWQPAYVLPFIEDAYDRPFTDDIEPPPELTSSASQLTTRYPSGPITPHGAYHVLHGDQPMVAYRSFDDTVVFHLMGGLAIPDRYAAPESVRLTDLKGLIPPWQNITQKGATQDGETYITSLYDPLEIDMTVMAKGRDANYTRKLIGHWIRSWDAKQPGELSWFTPQEGRWWAPVRWAKNPVDNYMGGNFTRQEFTWTAIAHDAFWRSYDDVAEFGFSYSDSEDDFNYEESPGLGAGWDLAYTGTGGYIYADGHQAAWSQSGTSARTVAARKVGYASTTDNQVVSVKLGTFPEWHLIDTAFNDIWARMATTGTAGASGVRLRFGIGTVRLSYFTSGNETLLRQIGLLIPPMPGETWSLVTEGRTFTVRRGSATVMTVVESGTGSPLGASNRGAGFGMEAGAGLWDQANPSNVWTWSAGDNSTVAQSGFLTRINAGDQPMWDRYTLYGPGTFLLGDGPSATTTVSYGPLLDNQVVQIRTDPRKRAVVDLSTVPPTPQQLTLFQAALQDFISWATGNNVPPLLQEIENLFGIQPPQGNLYSLMDGRFSNPIPAKSPGKPAQEYQVAVSIDDGNANSRIVAAGTPLRRYPY